MNIFKEMALKYALKGQSFDVDTKQIGKGSAFGFDGLQKDSDLIDQGYVSNTDVFSIISSQSEDGSAIPFIIKNVKADGSSELVNNGEFYDFMQMPNPDQTFKQFLEQSIGFLMTTGDLFYHKLQGVGSQVVDELSILESNLTDIKINKFNQVSGYERELNGITDTFTADEVLHEKYFNPSKLGIESKRGLSPLQAGYRTLVSSNNGITAMASFYENKGAAGMLTNKSQMAYNEQQKKDIQKVIDKKLGGAHNANKIVATTANVDFIQMGMSPADLKIIESGVLTLRQLCNLYKHPSVLYNDPQGMTFNSFSTAMQSYYTRAVIPVNERIVSQFNNFIAPGYSKKHNKNYIVSQDITQIEALQKDKVQEAVKNAKVAEGISKVSAQVGRGGISKDSAIEIIAHSYGLTLEDAAKFVSDGQE